MKRILAVVLLSVALAFVWIPAVASSLSPDSFSAAAAQRVTSSDPGLPIWPY